MGLAVLSNLNVRKLKNHFENSHIDRITISKIQRSAEALYPWIKGTRVVPDPGISRTYPRWIVERVRKEDPRVAKARNLADGPLGPRVFIHSKRGKSGIYSFFETPEIVSHEFGHAAIPRRLDKLAMVSRAVSYTHLTLPTICSV